MGRLDNLYGRRGEAPPAIHYDSINAQIGGSTASHSARTRAITLGDYAFEQLSINDFGITIHEVRHHFTDTLERAGRSTPDSGRVQLIGTAVDSKRQGYSQRISIDGEVSARTPVVVQIAERAIEVVVPNPKG